MRAAGFVEASHQCGGLVTTRRDQEARPAPNLVDRNFVTNAPDRLWVAEITYVPPIARRRNRTGSPWRASLPPNALSK